MVTDLQSEQKELAEFIRAGNTAHKRATLTAVK